MFGGKLRSWMEAVRPRKKQQRKEKQKQLANANAEFVTKFKTVPNSQSSEAEMASVDSKSMQTIASQGARYSGANLSSPESAYSTGYSTDGTSPGAPPEYYINIRTGTRYFPSESDKCGQTPTGNHLEPATRPLPQPPPPPPPATATRRNLSPVIRPAGANTNNALGQTEKPSVPTAPDYDKIVAVRSHNLPANNVIPARITEVVVVNSSLMSPRQRNRIRTNPWVPGSNLSPCNSSVGLHLRGDHTPRASLMNSPVPARYLSPTVPCSPINRVARCASLSSSSCSSLSAASLNWDANLVRDDPRTPPSAALIAAVRSPRFHAGSDEDDDCTLNEMMGKYDESYVYEKETDILSDSDPTDCETDIDTGQDGGDEDDPLETEFDFIDNGSFLEFNIKDERLNTGHCTYYNFEMQRKCSSRKRTTRRSRKDSSRSERRRRSTSSKKRHKAPESKSPNHISEGTRSAGATPVSVRRTKHPISKLALDDSFRRRSNSVSIPRDPVHFFDKRDKEADKKYKELIVEAEHILKNMKSSVSANGLSPRRLPGPPNKRVELLRTENQPLNVKPELKNRLNEDTTHPRIPSTFSPRFSPKRNHLTKFINSNSPILIRREEITHSPVLFRKSAREESPLMTRRQPKTDLPSRRSPKYRKRQILKHANELMRDKNCFSSDSEEEEEQEGVNVRDKLKFANECPQSEPVKRKIYSNQSKSVAFNLAQNITTATHTEISMSIEETCRKSCESLRQQVLLNTISNLKRSLEDQSASLKQVYQSSQNLHT